MSLGEKNIKKPFETPYFSLQGKIENGEMDDHIGKVRALYRKGKGNIYPGKIVSPSNFNSQLLNLRTSPFKGDEHKFLSPAEAVAFIVSNLEAQKYASDIYRSFTDLDRKSMRDFVIGMMKFHERLLSVIEIRNKMFLEGGYDIQPNVHQSRIKEGLFGNVGPHKTRTRLLEELRQSNFTISEDVIDLIAQDLKLESGSWLGNREERSGATYALEVFSRVYSYVHTRGLESKVLFHKSKKVKKNKLTRDIEDPKYPHIRTNILTSKGVLVSPQRISRPWKGATSEVKKPSGEKHKANCPFCQGNRRGDGVVNPMYNNVYWFPNGSPAMYRSPDAVKKKEEGSPFFHEKPVSGDCSILVYSPDHSKKMATMSSKEIGYVVRAWQRIYRKLGKRPDIIYVAIIENNGPQMAASQEHGHEQIWASSMIPDIPKEELENQRNYYKKNKSHLLIDYLYKEIESRERVIYENEDFAIVVPYWAYWPFETMIIPKQNITSVDKLTEQQMKSLSDTLYVLTKTYDRVFDAPMQYGLAIHQAPTDGNKHEYQTMHIHFYPPALRSPEIAKLRGMYENAQMDQRDITPESAAGVLKNAYKKFRQLEIPNLFREHLLAVEQLPNSERNETSPYDFYAKWHKEKGAGTKVLISVKDFYDISSLLIHLLLKIQDEKLRRWLIKKRIKIIIEMDGNDDSIYQRFVSGNSLDNLIQLVHPHDSQSNNQEANCHIRVLEKDLEGLRLKELIIDYMFKEANGRSKAENIDITKYFLNIMRETDPQKKKRKMDDMISLGYGGEMRALMEVVVRDILQPEEA